MTTLIPRHPNLGYALEGTRENEEIIKITFLRSVGYDTTTKTTPAGSATLGVTEAIIVLEALLAHPDDNFTLLTPSTLSGHLRFEHRAARHAPRRVNLDLVQPNGTKQSTDVDAEALVQFLSELTEITRITINFD